MKRFFYLIIISIVFYACKPGIPKDIIQPGKMQDVLLDIHIVDGYVSTLPGTDTAKKVGAGYYKGVFKKFDIDSALYNQSINYYYKHPDLMKKMYDSIAVKLTTLKDKNTFVVDDILSNYIFIGIFDKNASDTTIYDTNLNRKYNNRVLKTNVFLNITNPFALRPLNVVPSTPTLPTATTQPLPTKETLPAIAEPTAVPLPTEKQP